MDVTDFLHIDEEDFEIKLDMFLGSFGHEWSCLDKDEMYVGYFSSKIRSEIYERREQDNGFIFHQVPQWLYQYCTASCNKNQLFAVVFAVWYGLPEKECQLIGDRSQPELAKYILNAFLCGKSYSEICQILRMEGKTSEEKRRMLYIEYEGEVTIFDCEGKKIALARKDGDWLTDIQNSKRYRVWHD